MSTACLAMARINCFCCRVLRDYIRVRRGSIPFTRTGSLSFTDLNGPPYLWVPGDDQAALYSNGTVIKEQLGEERVNVISGLPGHTPSLRKPEQEAKAGTQAGTDTETMKDTVYWLAQACFLIYSRTTCLGVAPPTVGWVFPHQSSIKRMSHRVAHRPV